MNKELFKGDWVSLYQTPDGYVFSHETRCKGHIVSILPYDDNANILARFELCPAHGKSPVIEMASITGGVEHDDPYATALHELKEEAGIDATIDELEYLGEVYPSKSSDSVVHLFAIDVTGKPRGEAKGDGSQGEKGAFCKFVDFWGAIDCKDPLMQAAFLRRFRPAEIEAIER